MTRTDMRPPICTVVLYCINLIRYYQASLPERLLQDWQYSNITLPILLEPVHVYCSIGTVLFYCWCRHLSCATKYCQQYTVNGN